MSTSPDLPLSPAFGVENIDHHAGENVIGQTADGAPVHSPAFTTARQTMALVTDAATRMHEADKALAAAGTIDPREELRLRRGFAKAFGGAVKSIEDAITSLGEHRATADREIAESIGVERTRTSVTDAMRGTEIRAALVRITDPMKRVAALQDILTSGEAESAAAVLAAPALASGISREEQQQFRRDAERQFAPAAFARRESIDKLAGRLRTAGAALAERFADRAGAGDTPAAHAERAMIALEGGAA